MEIPKRPSPNLRPQSKGMGTAGFTRKFVKYTTLGNSMIKADALGAGINVDVY
jgi:hypothetical protein